MTVYFGDKKIKEMYWGGLKIREAWYGGRMIYTSRSPFGGREAFFDLLDRDGYKFETGLPDTKVVAGRSTSSHRNTHLHVVCGDEASVLIEQANDGRRALDLTVSGGRVTVKSTGDRGRNNLDFSGDWPGGEHVLSVSTSSDRHGYRMTVFVDGVEIATQSNGGAFTPSENFITTGDIRTTLKGCSAIQPLYFNALSASRRANIRDAVQHGVTWRVLTEPWSGEFAVPGGQMEAWIYSGGQGGQGSQAGSPPVAGEPGADGKGRYVGTVGVVDLAGFSPGRGGSGGKGTSSFNPPGEGSPGEASSIQLADGRVIDSAGSDRPVPAVRGVRFSGSLPGSGGEGGEAIDSFGQPGSPGGKGGLVVARYW